MVCLNFHPVVAAPKMFLKWILGEFFRKKEDVFVSVWVKEFPCYRQKKYTQMQECGMDRKSTF